MARDVLARAKSQLATDDNAVHFECPYLEASIRKYLKKPEGTITRKDVASLEEFTSEGGDYLDDGKISDLAGLEYATSLTELNLWNNEITDITPLKGLTSLTKLYLYVNNITDITPLAGLTNLTELDLRYNNIIDDQRHLLTQALPNCNIT